MWYPQTPKSQKQNRLVVPGVGSWGNGGDFSPMVPNSSYKMNKI